jgi:ribosomal subunit interface protein
MDIVIKGRNVEVPDHYRDHVSEKLTRLERYNRKTIRADVELFHEPNPRQSKNCQRIEITLTGKGAPVRAKGRAGDFYAALDCATSKLENRLRRMHDRRKVHYGRRNPTSVAEATGALKETNLTRTLAPATRTALLEEPLAERGEVPTPRESGEPAAATPGRVVREKEHPSEPMTVDQALSEMELVGHDFYLFVDSDTRRPSVVYRRKGFDYGVIRLAA